MNQNPTPEKEKKQASPDPSDESVRKMLEFLEKNRTQLRDVSVKELIHEGHRL